MNINKYVKYLLSALVIFSIIFIFIFFCVQYPIKYKNEIIYYSEKYGIEPSLIFGLICVESSFNRGAVSSAGALGLMQVMPSTAMWVCEETNINYDNIRMFEPSYNISIGIYYLHYLLNKFDNKEVALCAYNAGEGVVASWLKNEECSKDKKTLQYIPYKETRNYIKKVCTCEKIYKGRIGIG